VSIAERRDRASGERPAARGARLFRAINERIRELEGDRPVGQYDFFCECEDETCTGVLRLSANEYESVRSDANQFAVLPGHERPTEEVIRRTARFVVVGKGDDAGGDAPAEP
jgi:hypothetical protein